MSHVESFSFLYCHKPQIWQHYICFSYYLSQEMISMSHVKPFSFPYCYKRWICSHGHYYLYLSYPFLGIQKWVMAQIHTLFNISNGNISLWALFNDGIYSMGIVYEYAFTLIRPKMISLFVRNGQWIRNIYQQYKHFSIGIVYEYVFTLVAITT